MKHYNYRALPENGPERFEATGERYDAHHFYAVDDEDARHWVINHLDTSIAWTVRPLAVNH